VSNAASFEINSKYVCRCSTVWGEIEVNGYIVTHGYGGIYILPRAQYDRYRTQKPIGEIKHLMDEPYYVCDAPCKGNTGQVFGSLEHAITISPVGRELCRSFNDIAPGDKIFVAQ
jgi:hypothetical protein